MPFPAALTMNNAYYVNAILNRVSLFLTKKLDELITLMLICAKLLSTYLFLFQGDNTAARKNCHNDSETNPLFAPLTHIPEEKETHLDDMDTTTKSHLDVMSNLLSDTSSMKSLQSLCKINHKY